MRKTQQPEIVPAPKPSRSTVLLMLATFASTTWRVFVPTLVGIGLGFWLDATYHSSPWYMVAGTLVGSWVAVWLIFRQLKAIRK